MTSVVLSARDIVRDYHVGGGLFSRPRTIHAVKGVSLSVEKGKTLAIVGESGCGKSTLARIITLIDPATSGDLHIDGVEVDIARDRLTPELRRKVQIVFQNPYGSLNPRQKIGDVLGEPLLINTGVPAGERRDRAMTMLKKVGLEEKHFNRYPHMFSGGQRQRIAIARALMVNPSLLVLDEPVSALDLSVQAQILNLLADLQDEMKLTYIFVSHNLSVVRHVSDEVMVMYRGEVVEHAPGEALFADPRHPYTLGLLRSVPRMDEPRRERLIPIEGMPPDLVQPPPGCPFAPRCAYAVDRSELEMPELRVVEPGHKVACWVDVREAVADGQRA